MEASDGAHEPEDASAALASLLHRRLRVTISDGRVLVGRLLCTDRDVNLVVGETREYAPGALTAAADAEEPPPTRYVNTVMIPGQSIDRIELGIQ